MSKNKQRGTLFEVMVLKFLKKMLPFMDLDRMPLKGSKDEGDIRGFTIRGLKCVIECKNQRRMELAKWADEAEEEMNNANAAFWFVAFKRRGCGEARMGKTYVLTDLENLAALAAGSRELMGGEEE